MVVMGVGRADVKDIVRVRRGPIAAVSPLVIAAVVIIGTLGTPLVALGVDETSELVVEVACMEGAVAHCEYIIGVVVVVWGRGVCGRGRGWEVEALLADVGLVLEGKRGRGGGGHKYLRLSNQASNTHPIVSIPPANGPPTAPPCIPTSQP